MSMGAFIGVTVGMISLFLTVMLKSLRYQPVYANDRWLICGGLAAVGLVLLVTGLFAGQRRPRPTLDDGEMVAPSPFLLANIAYWGFLFLLFGGAAALVSPKTRTVRAGEAKPTNFIAKPIIAMNPKFSIVEGAPAPAVAAATVTNQLATLKLQGIVYDKVKPSAIINGRTYFVGDGLRDAKIISIEPSEVVVQLDGHKRTLRLSD